MKRILVLNYEFPPLGGGGGVAAYKLSKGFVRNGYEIDYITSWYKGLKKFEAVDGINVYRVRVIGRKELATASMISMLSYPIAGLLMGIKLCRKYNYEFINTQFVVPTGPLGYVLSKLFRVKNIISLHGGDIYDPTKKSSPHQYWIFRKTISFLLNHAHAVVAQSSNTKTNAQKYYSLRRNIEVIPLPYEPFAFAPVLREELGLKEEIFYTISVGRLVKRKGFSFLIRGIAAVADQKVHALIIGDGPEKENLMTLAQELRVSERVHFLGALSEEKKFQYLSNADVYVLSSVHEGFGIVLQEAMQVGLPIISTDNGGQVDFVKDGKNGRLIKFGDQQKLAQVIAEFYGHRASMDTFAMHNKQSIALYAPGLISKQYLALV